MEPEYKLPLFLINELVSLLDYAPFARVNKVLAEVQRRVQMQAKEQAAALPPVPPEVK